MLVALMALAACEGDATSTTPNPDPVETDEAPTPAPGDAGPNETPVGTLTPEDWYGTWAYVVFLSHDSTHTRCSYYGEMDFFENDGNLAGTFWAVGGCEDHSSAWDFLCPDGAPLDNIEIEDSVVDFAWDECFAPCA